MIRSWLDDLQQHACAGSQDRVGNPQLPGSVGSGTPASSLGALTAANRLVILSGGSGILLGSEPIGWYERAFHCSDWPHGLLESCLVNVARSLAPSHVVAFCSASTGYARLLRRTRWHVAGLDAVLVSPAMEDRGGAMRLAPRTAGLAVRSYLDGELNSDWRSVDDVAVLMEESS